MEKKEFIKQWMKTYEPDTFKQGKNGRYFYRSEDLSSGIDLECFFEELLTEFESAQEKETEQQSNCNLPNVSGALPLLITEKYDDYYLAYLKGINGMVVEAQSEDEAIDELMISIRVKLLHDRQ